MIIDLPSRIDFNHFFSRPFPFQMRSCLCAVNTPTYLSRSYSTTPPSVPEGDGETFFYFDSMNSKVPAGRKKRERRMTKNSAKILLTLFAVHYVFITIKYIVPC